ncbi:MAG: hypothetical protein U0169_19485 [Polyangiaceae bacterium]
MLRQIDCGSFVYDAASDTATLVATAGALPDARSFAEVAGSLLVDAEGRWVGADVDTASHGRHVLMLGPHEAVDRVVPATLAIARDAEGTPTAVRVASARSMVRGAEPTPYVGR